MKAKWEVWGDGVPLVILPSPYRSFLAPCLAYIRELREKNPDGWVTVLLPEVIPARWWQNLLHNQRALLIKGSDALAGGTSAWLKLARSGVPVSQLARTSDMRFGAWDLVSWVSGVMTLVPGDVILTGTPGGISELHPGDTVEVRIEGIGSLVNPVVTAEV